ncbi:efflux RND transporter periplasmic adaptor subunit [Roseovarius aquimarinus]|uniref:Efflux RND transporter periplasmic adaptor subunit n=1 Tax=Roseovarius aquimarinus TaxID=1229156 RepID=A0ABW7I8M6_9RHOB
MLIELSLAAAALALLWGGVRMRLRYRGLVSLSLGALLLVAVGLRVAGVLSGSGGDAASAPTEARGPVRPIDWAEAVPFTDSPVRRLTGTVRAADRAPLGFEVDGRVARVAAEIGDSFAKGDVLATLETTSLQIALDQARAALIEAEAMNVEAALEYRRQSTLFERDVVSAAARDRARAAADSAKSRLAVAQARVADARERLEDAELIAPYDGQIAARLIEPAQLYRPGEPAFEVQSSASGFEIEVTVPGTVISRIALGTQHEAALLDGSGEMLDAALIEIGSRATRRSGFPIVLAVSDAPAGLRAGMAAEVALRLDADSARAGHVGVPLASIAVEDGAARAVFVFQPEAGTLRRQPVTLGGVEGEMALISEGIDAGDIVATAGLPFLRGGMEVTLIGQGVARYDR